MSVNVANRDGRRGCFDAPKAISTDSQEVERSWGVEQNYLRGSASDWLPIVNADFRRIRRECQTPGWDGEDSKPVTHEAVRVAAAVADSLFALLPMGTPAPDVIPEADGEICFHWSIDANHVFSLSVGAHGKANFAGQFGKGGSVHAWTPIAASNQYELEEALQDVVRYVGRLFEQNAARCRT